MARTWQVIEHPEEDVFDLLEDGRAALYDVPQVEVERYIEDFGSPQDEIILEELDGRMAPYQWDQRPRWRAER